MDALKHRPLTILQILPALQGGGVERGTLEVARHHPAVEVKGATYTELSVKRDEEGRWIAQCVVDV